MNNLENIKEELLSKLEKLDLVYKYLAIEGGKVFSEELEIDSYEVFVHENLKVGMPLEHLFFPSSMLPIILLTANAINRDICGDNAFYFAHGESFVRCPDSPFGLSCTTLFTFDEMLINPPRVKRLLRHTALRLGEIITNPTKFIELQKLMKNWLASNEASEIDYEWFDEFLLESIDRIKSGESTK